MRARFSFDSEKYDFLGHFSMQFRSHTGTFFAKALVSLDVSMGAIPRKRVKNSLSRMAWKRRIHSFLRENGQLTTNND